MHCCELVINRALLNDVVLYANYLSVGIYIVYDIDNLITLEASGNFKSLSELIKYINNL